MIDVSDWLGKNDRIVYRIKSVVPCEAHARVLHIWIDDNEVGATAVPCLGFAIVEKWVEKQVSGKSSYHGPSWLTDIVPVWQDAEGIMRPYNDDPDDCDGLIITSATSHANVRAWVKNRYPERADALTLACFEALGWTQ